MTEAASRTVERGQVVRGTGGARIGKVDAVFVDYLLVRSGRLLPVDLYVPRDEVRPDEHGGLRVARSRREAYDAWHRPLKKAPHD